MLNSLSAIEMPGMLEWILFLMMLIAIILIPIVAFALIIRSLIRNKRENQKLRLEVGKLADELEKLRKQKKDE